MKHANTAALVAARPLSSARSARTDDHHLNRTGDRHVYG